MAWREAHFLRRLLVIPDSSVSGGQRRESPLGTTIGIGLGGGTMLPHLVLFAGLHGEHLAGQLAASILAHALEVPKDHGRVSLFMNANPAACLVKQRFAPTWAGGETTDLDRSFNPNQRSCLSMRDLPEHQHADQIEVWLENERTRRGISLVLTLQDRSQGPSIRFECCDHSGAEFIPKAVAGLSSETVWECRKTSLLECCNRHDIPALVQEAGFPSLAGRVGLHLQGVLACCHTLAFPISLDWDSVRQSLDMWGLSANAPT